MTKYNIANPLLDDGERMIPDAHKDQIIYGEHVARYEAVLPVISNQTVLDIACGSGYGTQIMALSAAKVYGVDNSQAAIEYAKNNFAGRNIDYLVGNCENIPLRDASVDIIVSFETIEHLENPAIFLKEIKRVLKPNGKLIISTPNDKVYPKGNEFHLHQFDFEGLKSHLNEHFSFVQFYFQNTWLCSAILSESNFTAEWSRPLNTLKAQSDPLDKALYFLAVCSNDGAPSQLKETGALSQSWSALEKTKRTSLERLLSSPEIPDQDKLYLQDQFNLLSSKLEEATGQINEILGSRTWRLAKLLRKIKRLGR